MEDKRVIACNYAIGISSCAKGARAYVIMIPGDGAHVEILARSRSGRWIQKWEHRKKLVHFRFVTLPPTHPRYHDSRIADYYDYLGDGVTALSLA